MVVGDIEDEHDDASARMIVAGGRRHLRRRCPRQPRRGRREPRRRPRRGGQRRGHRHPRRLHRDARRPRAVPRRTDRRARTTSNSRCSTPIRGGSSGVRIHRRGAAPPPGGHAADRRSAIAAAGKRRRPNERACRSARHPGLRGGAAPLAAIGGRRSRRARHAALRFSAGPRRCPRAGGLAPRRRRRRPSPAARVCVGGPRSAGAGASAISSPGLWWLGAAFLVEADQFAWALPFGVLGLPALLAFFPAFGFALARLLWTPGAGRILALAAGLTAQRMAARAPLHRLSLERPRHGARRSTSG